MRAAKQAAGGSQQWTSLSMSEVIGAVPSLAASRRAATSAPTRLTLRALLGRPAPPNLDARRVAHAPLPRFAIRLPVTLAMYSRVVCSTAQKRQLLATEQPDTPSPEAAPRPSSAARVLSRPASFSSSAGVKASPSGLVVSLPHEAANGAAEAERPPQDHNGSVGQNDFEESAPPVLPLGGEFQPSQSEEEFKAELTAQLMDNVALAVTRAASQSISCSSFSTAARLG